MWMAELSSRTGLTVPTIKFYLREGLIPAGEATGATRARYDDTHVRRLRLIRALTEVAGLRLETVRQVLEDIDSATTWHDAVGSAHTRLSPEAPDATEASLARVQELLKRNGWTLAKTSRHRGTLARALDVLDGLGHRADDELLDSYANAMAESAEVEISHLPKDP
ncbi:MAG TPA: MerR family transcriptional regulator, partial [Nocardioidaceae bacterium]|nr:MerR family transcriptional regulator [Nocardioidaceae bacterium]